jgi:hypothetical protein
VYFYTYGLPAYSDDPATCRYTEAAKMGFGYKMKAGCVLGPLKVARLDAHNNRIERKLIRRSGSDWHEQYEEAMNKCNPKKS